MLKSIDRYILKEVATPFSIGLLIYTFTLLLNMIFILSEQLIEKDASILTILQILLYLLPDLLSFTIPMSTLMGILAGLSRMSTDSEIVAFKTMGVNNLRILKPIMIFSLVAWILSSWLIMHLGPEGNYRYSELNTQLVLSKSIREIQTRVFNGDLQPYTIYFDNIDEKTGEWLNVFIYSKQKADSDTVILAKRGKYIPNPKEKKSYIVIKDAVFHVFKKHDPQKNYSCTRYSRHKLESDKLTVMKNSRRAYQLSFRDLMEKMEEEPNNVRFQIEFHRKFSLPFACLAMGFLALSLGVSTKKGGKISGFIISLGIVFVYYTIITACRNMVLKGVLPPALGMWAADIFLLVAGAIAYYYSSKERSIDWEKFALFFDRIRKRLFERERAREKQLDMEQQKKVLFVIKIKRFRIGLLRILDAYVVKKLVFTFTFVFLSLLMVFYIVQIMELVDNAIENKVAFYYILEYTFFTTPDMLQYVLPVSILTAVLLTFSVMSKNNEIVAVQVSGISLYRLALPAIIFGLVLSGIFFYVQEEVMPIANKNATKTMDIIRNRKASTEESYHHKRWVVGENNQFYFYELYNRRKKRYNRFNVIVLDDNFNIKNRISATFAHWDEKNENQMILLDGFQRKYKNDSPISFEKFPQLSIYIPGGESIFLRKIKELRYMNIASLSAYIDYLKGYQANTLRYEANLQNKYAYPFSCLVMVLIAIPFSFMMGKKGTLYGIGIAIGISIIFWGAYGIFTAMGSTGVMSPFFSAFAPLFIFSGISVYLFSTVKT